jgi:hypothetical protein
MYAVKTAYYYDGEAPRDTLAIDVVLCDSKEDAVAKLNDIIRNDWTTEVYLKGIEDPKPLADCMGMQEDQENMKWSDWFYSEDGTLAWSATGTHVYRGEVVNLGEGDDV